MHKFKAGDRVQVINFLSDPTVLADIKTQPGRAELIGTFVHIRAVAVTRDPIWNLAIVEDDGSYYWPAHWFVAKGGLASLVDRYHGAARG